MRVSVFGLGYVGCVCGACLAQIGHEVIGVDINTTKVPMVNAGQSPVVEAGIGEIVRDVVAAGRFRATEDAEEAVNGSDVALVCVGTPSQANGSLDLLYVSRVAEQIGRALKRKNSYFTIAMRSTVLPGTVDETVIPILEKTSGSRVGTSWGICMNPEFLREGSSVDDFYHPPKIVIGQSDQKAGNHIAALYQGLGAPVFRTSIRVAEMVKYSDNAFHALKVTFANEIGTICKRLGIDSHAVMNVFCQDTRLNISPAYLKPGFAFGGSCLGKDLRALVHQARLLDLESPLLRAVIHSNAEHLKRTITSLSRFKQRRIGFLGLSFKGGTDDLRESPLVEVIEALVGKGVSVMIYDRYVNLARLTGANKQYIDREIPHLARVMCDSPGEIVDACDVIVVGNYDVEFVEVLRATKKSQTVIDLVRVIGEGATLAADYDGICW